MADFASFNGVYGSYFAGKPARSCVGVRELPKGAICEVEVIDHGCGIEKEEIVRIFDRYFCNQGGNNKTGTGLGLPIAREIALRHGTQIICRSTPGEGTSFTLAFAEHEMKDA